MSSQNKNNYCIIRLHIGQNTKTTTFEGSLTACKRELSQTRKWWERTHDGGVSGIKNSSFFAYNAFGISPKNPEFRIYVDYIKTS